MDEYTIGNAARLGDVNVLVAKVGYEKCKGDEHEQGAVERNETETRRKSVSAPAP